MDDSVAQKNKALAWKLLVAAVAMFGFGYALVPIYDAACKLLFDRAKPGIPVAVKAVGYAIDKSREITVQFTTTVDQSAPLTFSVETKAMKVHPGQYYTVNFYAENKSERQMIAQAQPSFAPPEVYKYFEKVKCFCFLEQKFAPHERKTMPVRFVVKPDLPKRYKIITLAYTFFDNTEKSVKN